MNRYSPGFLITTNSEIYRCVGQPMVVVGLWATNISGSTQQWYTQHVPADASPSDEFSLIFNKTLGAKGATLIDTPIILQAGEAIYARASAVDSIVVTIYVIPYADFILGRI